MLLVADAQIETIEAGSLNGIGIVAIIFAFIIVILSAIRCGYTFYKLYDEYKNHNLEDKHDYVDWRLRNDSYYSSVYEQDRLYGEEP